MKTEESLMKLLPGLYLLLVMLLSPLPSWAADETSAEQSGSGGTQQSTQDGADEEDEEEPDCE